MKPIPKSKCYANMPLQWRLLGFNSKIQPPANLKKRKNAHKLNKDKKEYISVQSSILVIKTLHNIKLDTVIYDEGYVDNGDDNDNLKWTEQNTLSTKTMHGEHVHAQLNIFLISNSLSPTYFFRISGPYQLTKSLLSIRISKFSLQ